MDAELHLAPDSVAASPWLEAPMPGAALCPLQAMALSDPLQARCFILHNDLQRRLAEPSGAATQLAEDGDGGLWRIRACDDTGAGPRWWLQPLAESRFRLAALLRATMARRLAGHVLHELRNPLNAVSLYTDVLTLLVPKATSAEAQDKAATALKSIKDRLQELALRQQASVSLWSGDAEMEGPVSVSAIWHDVARLMGAYLTLNTIPLHSHGVEALERCSGLAPRPPLGMAWISLLMMAADAALLHPEGASERRVQLSVKVTSNGTLQATVPGPLHPAALGTELGLASPQAAAAALSLLLQACPATVVPTGEAGMILSLTPTRPEPPGGTGFLQGA